MYRSAKTFGRDSGTKGASRILSGLGESSQRFYVFVQHSIWTRSWTVDLLDIAYATTSQRIARERTEVLFKSSHSIQKGVDFSRANNDRETVEPNTETRNERR